MPKSPDAFRTISEVAEWLETPAHVLRFWESKFTQVKPVKRAGGRRYYRPADMMLLGGIKKLLHDDGLTIKGAQKLLREHGVKHVAELSQPLDEDLLEEAAYEADVAPMPEAPATVLNFPPRPAEPEKPAETPVQTAAPEAAPTTAQEVSQETPQSGTTAAPTDEVAQKAPQSETPEAPAPEDDAQEGGDPAPAFGGDALPAFMRRSASSHDQPDVTTPPPASTQDPTQSQSPSAHLDGPDDVESEPKSEATPEAVEPVQAKVAIDPVARFLPLENTSDDASASQDGEPLPRFLQRAEPETTPVPETSAPTDTPADTPAEPAQAFDDPARAPIDLPPIAKIAPELSSYDAPAGVLSRIPNAGPLSPELALEMSHHLQSLRDLRNRMRA